METMKMIVDNIVPSQAARLEYDFVVWVAESEFYLQQANAWHNDRRKYALNPMQNERWR